MPFNNKLYDIKLKKLVVWLLPTPLRRSKMTAWLTALTHPIAILYDDFIAFRKAMLDRLVITPQVCYLEKLLNDRYDPIVRDIKVVDGTSYPPLFLYRKAEAKKVYLYRKSETQRPKTYLYTKREVGQFTHDFIVSVPARVKSGPSFKESEMKALIDAYKLATKIYTIA